MPTSSLTAGRHDGADGGRGGQALVIGYGLSGRAASSWLAGQGFEVVVLEDSRQAGRGRGGRGQRAGRGRRRAASRWKSPPGLPAPAELARTAALVVPSPGVPVGHPALVAALSSGSEVVSEVELAWRVLEARRRDQSRAWRLLPPGGHNRHQRQNDCHRVGHGHAGGFGC